MDLGVVQPSQGRGLTPSVPLLSHKNPSEQFKERKQRSGWVLRSVTGRPRRSEPPGVILALIPDTNPPSAEGSSVGL